MDIQALREFFMWCSVINAGLLMLSFLICVIGGDFVYNIHSKMFAMSREAFNIAIYSFIGIYKIVFIAFNLVPFIALSIICK
mgnify:CR=1 FL=1